MLEAVRSFLSASQQEGAPGTEDAAAAVSSLEIPAWVPEPVEELWQMLEAQPLLAFAVLVALGFLLAKLAEIVICRGLTRLTIKTETELDDRLIELLHRPVFVSVFLVGLALATRTLGLPPAFTGAVVKILRTLVVFTWLFAGFPIIRLVLDALGRIRDRFEIVEERTIPLFDITMKLLLFGGASYVILGIWGINPSAWLASAGVIGIAVGFAAKDTLANLFSGFFIVADTPYTLGDFIVLPTGERGQVTHVGIRSTRLLTRDDIEITMPNALIANGKIINESGGPIDGERIRVKVGVAYGSDVDQVVEVLKKLAVEHEHICSEPPPRVRLRGFGASSVDFELLCWIDHPVRRGKLSHELYMEVYKTFAELGIEIPFAQTDLHIKEIPAR